MSIADLAIPVLATERLILRGHCEADFEAMCAIWQDPVVVRHFHGKPQTREDIWAKLLKGFGMWALKGYGMWAVVDKQTGDYAGTVGTFEVRREMVPRIDDLPEAGWTLAPRFHGRGYATEAMRAALAWTDAKLGHPAMFCIVAPANSASIRVAEKCGFECWYETTYQDDPTLILRRDPVTSQRV
jgi:RimJ/RimL family protein N-acetyltransferase